MAQPLKLACIQMNSGPDMDASLDAAEAEIRKAAGLGASLVTTPENVACMIDGREAALSAARPEDEHPAHQRFSELAGELGIWLLAGSLSVLVEDGARIANRSLLYGDDGMVRARYDKIHLFDVDLAGGESYRESETVRPGTEAVVARTPFGQLGLSVCYDLRFAYLYRALAQAGAGLITVPSAFTAKTGKAHWEVLLRARAIETGCFIIAPAQTGHHETGRRGGRDTWGHSMIVSPWGEVLADAGEAPGVIIASIDMADVEKARRAVPSLLHDRPYSGPRPVDPPLLRSGAG